MKKSNIGEMLKLGFILAGVAAGACLMLAVVYNLTEPIIQKQQYEALKASIQDLFPEADDFEPLEGLISPDPTVTIEIAYAALKNGETIGVALETSRFSYSGNIKILVGVDVNDRITGVRILENPDTPGFGLNASSSYFFVDRARRITFYGQFAGKKVHDPFEVRRDIAVITASTITSRAVANSVKAAGLAVNVWFSGKEADIVTGATPPGNLREQ